MELKAGLIAVEVVDARPRAATVVSLQLAPGTSLGEAIAQAGFSPGAAIGVFGKPRRLTDPAADGDRIELYRNLPMDPKDRRRSLSSRAKRGATSS